MIYLDHAAYPWPRPTETYLQLVQGLLQPTTDSHGDCYQRSRSVIAEVMNATTGSIMFTHGASAALDWILTALLHRGDQVIVSSMEHAAVMEPLSRQVEKGVVATCLPVDHTFCTNTDTLVRSIRPETRAVIWTHASNVIGAIQPLQTMACVLKERGILLIVDAAQTVGVVPVDFDVSGIDILAFTGHKGLYGPYGSGGLIVRSAELAHRLDEFRKGQLHTEWSPPNPLSLQYLADGVKHVAQIGITNIRQKEMSLTEQLLQGLHSIPEIIAYGPPDAASRVGLVCFNIDTIPAEQVQAQLETDFGILCRAGLHHSPDAHAVLNTSFNGAVRFSVGYTNTVADIEFAVDAVRSIAARSQNRGGLHESFGWA